MNASKKQRNIKQVIVSILALLNVMFIPLFDVWGGLFPSDPDDTFWDVITGQCDPDQWIVVFTVAVLVPAVFMLIFSLVKATRLARIAGVAGLVWVLVDLIRFVDQYEEDYLFDFDDGNLSIGLWIAFALFLVMALIPTSKRSKEKIHQDSPEEIMNG